MAQISKSKEHYEPMTNAVISQDQINQKRMEIFKMVSELSEMNAQLPPEPIKDYEFETNKGTVSISDLFGAHEDLIVIHNMGPSCPYCTMWADSLAGQLPYIVDRAAIVLINREAPANQMKFAERRGWKIPMASDPSGDFARDMGFFDGEQMMPGFSTFHKGADGSITRVGHDFFGPNDLYLGTWHFFNLLKGGSEGFSPNFQQ